ncbi:hypothetical protein rpr22_0743 [Rickettsia prowazekii str. Rp22]|uniref:Uncharacterized protein n=1 Tax=Rickettsia prowazekii (strain Rp22) TaxID=449216 RepID=D5AXW5_RICPP|nr:hypothetical protein rpr22_0743 [Rickettsia prowazekii str. Rp22]
MSRVVFTTSKAQYEVMGEETILLNDFLDCNTMYIIRPYYISRKKAHFFKVGFFS